MREEDGYLNKRDNVKRHKSHEHELINFGYLYSNYVWNAKPTLYNTKIINNNAKAEEMT